MIGSGLTLALVPKCPVCLAADLSVLGVSLGLATPLAHWVQPAAMIAAAAIIGISGVRAWRAWHRPPWLGLPP
jgi:hypothetical protein